MSIVFEVIKPNSAMKSASYDAIDDNGEIVGSLRLEPSKDRYIFYPRNYKFFPTEDMVDIVVKAGELNREIVEIKKSRRMKAGL